VVPTFKPVRLVPTERVLRERLPVLRAPRLELARPAPAREAGFFAALARAAGFFAAERAVVFFAAAFFAAGFFAALARAAGFFAAERAVVFFAAAFFATGFFAAGFLAVDFFAADAVDFLAVERPAGLRPADLALVLAVAFLVAADFADLPADLLDAFLPAAAMSRSFLEREMMH
jgi:hypothetical protein